MRRDCSHKVDGLRQCLEAAGMSLLQRPPYGTDFNPIELAFAKTKELLRAMAPRSFDAICDCLQPIITTLSSPECTKR